MHSVSFHLFHFQPVNNRFCSSKDGAKKMHCDRELTGPWEQFDKVDQGDGTFALRCSNGKYVSSEGGVFEMSCNRQSIGPWEKFRLLDPLY